MELLAPAGGISTALAAFDAGADAIYMGLNKFNARERTENFSFKELSQILAYAHKIGRKVHLAFNTLVKESEISEAMEVLDQIAELRPDAIIIQDLGILSLLRTYYPQLTVHVSTQMGIHNSAGVEWAARQGASRVILERQVTMEEIAEIKRKSKIEIEVFGHGALCCALSGGCFFSSFLGGASGNRGKCKQPCRRFYTGDKREGYMFSPTDLNVLPLIPELKKLNIESLKIEGRMKKADYVANVVSAYRILLDAKVITPELLAEAGRILQSTAGRTSSTGFASRKNFDKLVVPERPGVWGFPIGQVTYATEKMFSVKLTRKLHRGDRVRLLTKFEEDGPALIVGGLAVNNSVVQSAKAGEICTLSAFKSGATVGAMVYKIGECPKDHSARAAALPMQRTPIDLKIAISNSEAEVQVVSPAGIKPFYYGLELQEAQNRGVTAEDVTKVFSQTNSNRYELGSCEVEIAGKLFFPASLLKEFRRDFFSMVDEAIISVPSSKGNQLYNFYNEYTNRPPAPECGSTTLITNNGTTTESIEAEFNAIPIKNWQNQPNVNELLLPQLCPEGELGNLRAMIKKSYNAGIRRYRVCAIYALELLKGYSDITIISASPLPACNSQATAILKQEGVDLVQLWPEFTNHDAINLAKKSLLPLEQQLGGAVELLQSRAILPVEGRVKDRRGNAFIVKHDKADGLYKLHTNSVLQLSPIANCGKLYDLRHNSGRSTTAFNFDKEWL